MVDTTPQRMYRFQRIKNQLPSMFDNWFMFFLQAKKDMSKEQFTEHEKIIYCQSDAYRNVNTEYHIELDFLRRQVLDYLLNNINELPDAKSIADTIAVIDYGMMMRGMNKVTGGKEDNATVKFIRNLLDLVLEIENNR